MSLDGSQHLSLNPPDDDCVEVDNTSVLHNYDDDDANGMEDEDDIPKGCDSRAMHDVAQNQIDLSQNFSFDPLLFDFNNTWTAAQSHEANDYLTDNLMFARGGEIARRLAVGKAGGDHTGSNFKRRSSMGDKSYESLLDSTSNNDCTVSDAAVASQSPEANDCLTENMMFARGGGEIARRLAVSKAGGDHAVISVTDSSSNRANTRSSSDCGDTNRSTTTSVTTARSSIRALDSNTNMDTTLSKEQPATMALPTVPTGVIPTIPNAYSPDAAVMASFFASHQTMPAQQQSSAIANMLFDPSLLPLAFNAMAAAGGGAFCQEANAAPTIHPPNITAPTATVHNSSANQGVPASQPFIAPSPPVSPPVATTTSSVGIPTTAASTNGAPQITTHHHHQQQQQQQANLPPFLLFDAPIELRANFAAAQRALGLTPLQDNNSIHYGLPPMGSTHPHHRRHVHLVDGRHGDLGNKRVKNEREQRRTQKIADLIDHLRAKMENGGWKVGLKSKFHTLSSCAEYVKHLKQVNKEKEEALEKAKRNLKEKQRKMEEENRALQEGPSDPESTTSSLTVSSGSEGRKTDGLKKVCPESTAASDDSKRKAEEDVDRANKKAEKKARLRSHESSGTSSSESGGGMPIAEQSVNVDQFFNVSDITDSNKDSSSDGNSSSGQPNTSHKASNAAVHGAAAAAREPSADRDDHSNVVIAGRKRKASKHNRPRKHQKNMSLKFELDYEEVFLKSNVPQILATTSGRIVAWNDFFLKATGLTAKEIDRLTIFSLVQPSNLSNLFEIVAAALRYGTLDTEASENSSGHGTRISSAASTDGRSEYQKPEALGATSTAAAAEPSRRGGNDFSTITLPCASFGLRPKHVDGRGSDEINKQQERFTIKPLYMTVTLMADDDPRKRCFHCVLTDYPGTNGSLGRVTPELLSLLFQ